MTLTTTLAEIRRHRRLRAKDEALGSMAQMAGDDEMSDDEPALGATCH